jgi:bifunctional enzyme Fae/Hps
MLDTKTRYLQVAFNYDLGMVVSILPTIQYNPRIWIEAGTPFIKREGMNGVRAIRKLWRGTIVADMKTMDGAIGEVDMAKAAGADAITILGASPTESLNLFVRRCEELKMLSMVDMIGVEDPLEVLRPMRKPPDVVVLHRGRDEESSRGKVIQYKHVNRIRSKYDVAISAAGGVTLKEARSAIFNGANIVVANIVKPEDKWQGISTKGEVGKITRQFLETIE